MTKAELLDAKKKLSECGVPMDELRDQWVLQQAAQLLLQARKLFAFHSPDSLTSNI